jgi:hypothetical protein
MVKMVVISGIAPNIFFPFQRQQYMVAVMNQVAQLLIVAIELYKGKGYTWTPSDVRLNMIGFLGRSCVVTAFTLMQINMTYKVLKGNTA